MTDAALGRVRKSYHLLRRRFVSAPPERLVIEKAKWLNDVRSPVMLMIDDLTNAWHNHQGGKSWQDGGDWGAGFDSPNSALRFLEDGLGEFARAKITFFAVAGAISPYTHGQPFSYAAPLDATDKSRRFFRSLAENPRYELAYHGFNHGSPGVRSEDFIQEWRGFASVAEAVAQTRKGLEIFSRTIGKVPTGGKYGGWAYNDLAEDAINEVGFSWWCRDWTPRDITGRIRDGYYEPQLFGRTLVVALPSTVHGYFWNRRQIDLLLKKRQIISIAEHIAPVRPDGRIQTPNIVDDMGELVRLYRYLDDKDVWHATGSDIASYVLARDRSLIYDVTRDGFSIRYEGAVDRPQLTLRVDSAAVCSPAQPFIEVTAPDRTGVDTAACRFDRQSYGHLVTVPVMNGRYRVAPTANEGQHAA